uniref:ADP/ATP translocase n=1 Tax=Arundo donax TaxID=35708 RepID=A0A0A9E260_ARUDO
MKPLVLVGPFEGNFFASFALGWAITTFSGVCAYPFDTVCRRMMLTPGQPFKYRNGLHAVKHIVSTERFLTLFRGVGANILSGMAGAGVLSGYDQLQRFASRHGQNFERKMKGGIEMMMDMNNMHADHSFKWDAQGRTPEPA